MLRLQLQRFRLGVHELNINRSPKPLGKAGYAGVTGVAVWEWLKTLQPLPHDEALECPYITLIGRSDHASSLAGRSLLICLQMVYESMIW